jgi:hypothetical protein
MPSFGKKWQTNASVNITDMKKSNTLYAFIFFFVIKPNVRHLPRPILLQKKNRSEQREHEQFYKIMQR